MPLKTLFLNPPSFENFDGGAGSRWPATREIESYWYPVWLAYPAGMLEGARLLDAPPHHVTAEETIRTCRDYELLVLFTSTPGFPGDIRLAEAIKDSNPMAGRWKKFSACHIARMAALFTTPIVRRSKTSTLSRTSPTCIVAISTCAATMCRFCCTRSLRFTPRVAARRSVRSACGRKL